jgi:tyrosyl-DNA phosphodiesterase 2
MKPIRIATTQLECPSPPAPMHCMERYIQAEHAVVALGSAANVVFGGDMSWDDNTDLPFPLPAGWVDAWTLMKPHEVGTGSSSTRSGDWIEPFRAGGLCNAPRKRSDRFACKLRDYELRNIELVGTYREPGAGVQGYQLDRKEYVEFRPSCHYGMVLTIVPYSVPINEMPTMEEEGMDIGGLFAE